MINICVRYIMVSIKWNISHSCSHYCSVSTSKVEMYINIHMSTFGSYRSTAIWSQCTQDLLAKSVDQAFF